ncbi:MAG: N-acetyl-gamma-glutamyl-phosphate reductase [Bacteroidota bacterium]
MKIGIVGGAGYTGGELLRLLLRHPEAEIAFVHSNSQAGKPLSAVHTDLLGETELTFTQEVSDDIDLLFVCAGHGKTRTFLAAHSFSPDLKVIDLSRDFRLKAMDHDFVYGLPELNREAIREASRIANPGCFATAIQLALLPLAAAGNLQHEVHIHALTGATGAGQSPVPTTHFSWRDNNISIYKAFKHQHLGEINQSLIQLQPGGVPALTWLPLRGDFPRGIFASLYLTCNWSEEQAIEAYQQFYADHPFTVISPVNPNLKQVVNTNKAILFLQKHEDKLLIISMIDNLLKGASGQAVQNMNLMFGLEEDLGLRLKGSAF